MGQKQARMTVSEMSLSYLTELHQSPQCYYYCSRSNISGHKRKQFYACSPKRGLLSAAKRSKWKHAVIYIRRECWMSDAVNRCQSLSEKPRKNNTLKKKKKKNDNESNSSAELHTSFFLFVTHQTWSANKCNAAFLPKP